MLRKIAIAALVSSTIWACSSEKNNQNQSEMSNYDSTATGLKYKIDVKGTGDKPKPGSIVTVHYTGKLTNDSVFDSSVKRNQPFKFKLGQGQVIKGWDEGIALLGKGDKATLMIPPHLGYGERGAGGVIPPNATLIFEVELIDFQEPLPPAEPFVVEGLTKKKTASGLEYYIVKENPTGAKPEAGKPVSVHYTGYLENGTKFDSSVDRGDAFTFALGVGQVIPGWDEGISLLKTGEKARLVIPSKLGYGEAGAGGVIPPNATLIFDVELIKVN